MTADIAHLEGKAANSGVTIADLEPLLLTHLGASSEVVVASPAPNAGRRGVFSSLLSSKRDLSA